MKLKQYLTEGRSKKMTQADAFDFIEKHCQDALDAYANRNYIYRGVQHIGNFLSVDGGMSPARHSKNTTNHYTLMMDNFPTWKAYPKRSQSVICRTNSDLLAYGSVFNVLPVDGAKIGVCRSVDLWFSFRNLPYHTMNEFNGDLARLYEALTGGLHKGMDKDWKTLVSKLNAMDRGLKKREKTYLPKQFEEFKERFPFLEGYQTKLGLIYHIEQLMKPSKNDFQLKKIGQTLPEDREVWTDAKCILVNTDVMFKEYGSR